VNDPCNKVETLGGCLKQQEVILAFGLQRYLGLASPFPMSKQLAGDINSDHGDIYGTPPGHTFGLAFCIDL
jgi:hypothetical protein